MLTEDLEKVLREEKDFDEQLVLSNKSPDILTGESYCC